MLVAIVRDGVEYMIESKVGEELTSGAFIETPARVGSIKQDAPELHPEILRFPLPGCSADVRVRQRGQDHRSMHYRQQGRD